MKRRKFVKNSAVASASLYLGAKLPLATAEPAPKPPNIIFIMTDDQGWNHVSYRSDPAIAESASDFIETPNLAALSARGMRFTDAYAPSPICSPTRHSVLFGKNAGRHVYAKSEDWLNEAPGWPTLAGVIKQANEEYRTAHFGKWHVGLTPAQCGFDYTDGLTGNTHGELHNGVYKNSRALAPQINAYNEQAGISVPNPRYAKRQVAYIDEDPKSAFSLAQRAEGFIRDCVEDNKPFFSYIAHYAAHLDLVSSAENFDYFRRKKKGQRHDNIAYAAMCLDLDAAIGKTINLVNELGIQDNTYIVITSDNGGVQRFPQTVFVNAENQITGSQESEIAWRNLPLRHGKHEFYEGGIRVPFIASGPGIQAASVCRTPISGLDLLPTFSEMAGQKLPTAVALDGDSIMPLLRQSDAKLTRKSDALIFHQAANQTPISALRKGRYKLVKHWHAGQGCSYCGENLLELYDLESDIGESVDLASQLPALTQELHQELLRFIEEAGAETSQLERTRHYYQLLDRMGVEETAIAVQREYISPF